MQSFSNGIMDSSFFEYEQDGLHRWCTLGLGSNLGNSIQTIKMALEHLKNFFGNELQCSSIYCTPPLSGSEGELYANLVCQFQTNLNRFTILNIIQKIEQLLGRNRVNQQHWAARTIDIDFLFYETIQECSSHLILPHPFVLSRAFTMIPMYEIAPNPLIPHGRIAYWEAVMERLDDKINRLLPKAKDIQDIDLHWSAEQYRAVLREALFKKNEL